MQKYILAKIAEFCHIFIYTIINYFAKIYKFVILRMNLDEENPDDFPYEQRASDARFFCRLNRGATLLKMLKGLLISNRRRFLGGTFVLNYVTQMIVLNHELHIILKFRLLDKLSSKPGNPRIFGQILPIFFPKFR